jgi:hypothetical protein
MIAVGRHSDRTKERRWHLTAAGFFAAVGWGLSIWRDLPVLSFAGMVLAQSAMMSMWGPFWSLATAALGTRAAAGGIALINALANLASFFGPTIMGWSESTGDFTLGLAIMSLVLLLGSVLALSMRGVPASPLKPPQVDPTSTLDTIETYDD